MENNLPKGWAEVQLEDLLLSLESGSRPRGGVRGIMEGIPSIGGEHLNDDGGFDFSNIKFVPEEFALNMNRGKLETGDVLIVKDGATTGKTSFVGDNFPYKNAVVNEHVFICRTSSEFNSKYLFYFLWSKEGKDKILKNFKGSAQGGVNTTFASNLLVPVAPSQEQHRIVVKLDALMVRIERNKQRLEKIPVLLKRFRQSVLAAAVSGKLTEDWRGKNKRIQELSLEDKFLINPNYKEIVALPSGWEWTALGNYVKCQRGRFSVRPRNDPRYFGGNIPFIQIGDLPREGGFVKSHVQTLNEAGLKVSKMFPKNTVVVAIVGATIANTGILGYDMCFTDSMVGLDKGELSLNLYIDYYLRSEKENLRQLSYSSGGQPNIKVELLNEYPFPLAPLEEQKEIVRRVENLFAFADKIEASYTSAKARLDKLPQSILAKAFRGELIPQNPEDEPAIVLIERIKQQKKDFKRITSKSNNKLERYKKKYPDVLSFLKHAKREVTQTEILSNVKLSISNYLIDINSLLQTGKVRSVVKNSIIYYEIIL